MTKDLYELGEVADLGHVPTQMHAQVIRQDRFGEPQGRVPGRGRRRRPSSGRDEVLVYVMAAGVNYNNVWAALGIPVDVIAARQKKGETEDFHIGGSDASGIVWKVGNGRHQREGRRRGRGPLRHVGRDDAPVVKSGNDPMFAPTFSGSGATSRTGAASRSSPRSRTTSACRSRST